MKACPKCGNQYEKGCGVCGYGLYALLSPAPEYARRIAAEVKARRIRDFATLVAMILVVAAIVWLIATPRLEAYESGAAYEASEAILAGGEE